MSASASAPEPGSRLARADEGIYRALRVAPALERPVRLFSRSGEHAACWLALGAAAALIDRPRRDRWLRATGSVGCAYALNVALKHVVRRRRPRFDDLPALTSTLTELSFPSAHAASAFAAARAYSAIVPAAAAPLHFAATAMALSRVALGVHYPSDIAAGALLGTAVAEASR